MNKQEFKIKKIVDADGEWFIIKRCGWLSEYSQRFYYSKEDEDGKSDPYDIRDVDMFGGATHFKHHKRIISSLDILYGLSYRIIT